MITDEQIIAAAGEPVELPFAILDQELKDLHRFHECVTDNEGYDVPKDRMKRLAEIGLVRRCSGNYYEHTVFGLSIINGDFSTTTKPLRERIAELEANASTMKAYYEQVFEDGGKRIAELTKQRDDLVSAASDVIDRWNSPKWKDQPHTGTYIQALADAVAMAKGGAA